MGRGGKTQFLRVSAWSCWRRVDTPLAASRGRAEMKARSRQAAYREQLRGCKVGWDLERRVAAGLPPVGGVLAGLFIALTIALFIVEGGVAFV